MKLYIISFLLFLVLISTTLSVKELLTKKNHDDDVRFHQQLLPIIDGPNIMFWRPQKVGTSTILSILVSYGYRYNYLPRRKGTSNSFCRVICECALEHHNKSYLSYQMTQSQYHFMKKNCETKKFSAIDKMAEDVPFKISLTHELCNFNYSIIKSVLPYAFKTPKRLNKSVEDVKELFIVRDPLERAVSIYYFWGEIYKLSLARSSQNKKRNKNKFSKEKSSRKLVDSAQQKRIVVSNRIGKYRSNSSLILGKKFTYHGDEYTVPPMDIANRYAKNLAYTAGMPGPSYTWSGFSNNVQDGLKIIESNRIMTVILERLDESLVVLAHDFGWSLADVVVTKHRKALSSHPKSISWPANITQIMKNRLIDKGEYAIYDASTKKLDERIKLLDQNGVDFKNEVQTLKYLRKRVSEICLKNDTYLDVYRRQLDNEGFTQHPSKNKLRDVEDKFAENGHIFALNREILVSYDVCGSCEAHAILYSIKHNISTSLETAKPLSYLAKFLNNTDLNPKELAIFKKCPKFDQF
eukprot:gene12519-16791_t